MKQRRGTEQNTDGNLNQMLMKAAKETLFELSNKCGRVWDFWGDGDNNMENIVFFTNRRKTSAQGDSREDCQLLLITSIFISGVAILSHGSYLV